MRRKSFQSLSKYRPKNEIHVAMRKVKCREYSVILEFNNVLKIIVFYFSC